MPFDNLNFLSLLGEVLESGIQRSFILNEDEAVVVQAQEGFVDKMFGKGVFKCALLLFIFTLFSVFSNINLAWTRDRFLFN